MVGGAINSYTTKTKKMLPTYKLITTLILLLCFGFVMHADPGKNYQKRQKKLRNRHAQHYLEIAGGYGVWTRTFQAGMSSNAQPLDLSVLYGADHSAYAVRVGATLLTDFSQDIFLFKPRFAYTGVQISWLKLLGQDSRFDPFVFGGVAVWQAGLTDGVYDGIISYDEKKENDQGIGAVISTGFNYLLKSNWRLGVEVKYHHANPGDYLAGGFEPQKINPSYLAALVKVSYRLPLQGKGATCPSYY